MKGRFIVIDDKNAAFVYFGKWRTDKVGFFLPDRIPEEEWVEARLATLRQVDGINKVKCPPGAYELRVVVAPRYDVEEALAETILAVMDLMNVSSVNDFTVRADKDRLTSTASDLLVGTLQQIANNEWENIHALRLQEARESWASLDKRLQTLASTEMEDAAKEAQFVQDLADAEETLSSAGLTFEGVRKGDSGGTTRIAGRIVDTAKEEVDKIKHTLTLVRDNLKTLRETRAALQSEHDKVRTTLEELESLECPAFPVKDYSNGNIVSFKVETDPNDEEAEGAAIGSLDDEPGFFLTAMPEVEEDERSESAEEQEEDSRDES